MGAGFSEHTFGVSKGMGLDQASAEVFRWMGKVREEIADCNFFPEFGENKDIEWEDFHTEETSKVNQGYG